MNKEHPSKPCEDNWPDCRPRSKDDCDPTRSIDDRKSHDARLSARLEYAKTFAESLDSAKADYEKARIEYREERHEAALKVQDTQHQVKYVIERIKCLMEQERVLKRLDDAFEEVCIHLECCERSSSCCCDRDVHFEKKLPSHDKCGYEELQRQIENYQAEVAKAEACFKGLAEEPTKLVERVDAARNVLVEILAALAEDAAKVDLKRQYARALVLQRTLKQIWNGHGSSAEYIACICKTLTTWSEGVAVVAKLIGEKAFRDSQRKSADEWCASLTAGPVDEILAIYDRLCGSGEPCSTEEPEEPEGDHPDGCGCAKHHHPEETRAEQIHGE